MQSLSVQSNVCSSLLIFLLTSSGVFIREAKSWLSIQSRVVWQVPVMSAQGPCPQRCQCGHCDVLMLHICMAQGRCHSRHCQAALGCTGLHADSSIQPSSMPCCCAKGKPCWGASSCWTEKSSFVSVAVGAALQQSPKNTEKQPFLIKNGMVLKFTFGKELKKYYRLCLSIFIYLFIYFSPQALT